MTRTITIAVITLNTTVEMSIFLSHVVFNGILFRYTVQNLPSPHEPIYEKMATAIFS